MTNQLNPWQITHAEFLEFEVQFIPLKQADGFISGDQARNFFFQSGLQPQTLGQIWNLADFTRDGKLDKLEFSIAVKLIRNTIANIPLPPTLPESLKQIGPAPAPTTMPMMRPPAYGMPTMMPAPSYMPGQAPAPVQPTQFTMGSKELCDWTIPQQNKLRYSQRFNQLDTGHRDYLTGQQVRGVMGESQLPSNVLAQVWNFADSNNEGYLNIERFYVAMFLIDKIKEGYALPSKLPPELKTFSRRQSESPATPVQEPGIPPPQKTPALKTFEDKRRDNLDKGEAELLRRRQIHEEEERRRKEEIARKEREEAERLEQERKRLEEQRKAELERQMEIQRKLDEERMAEEAKIREEREAQRKKAEEERMKVLEQKYVQDLENQLLQEKEKTAQIKQRHNTMNFQLQEDDIMAITTEIEGMRKQRDEKISKIQSLQNKNQEIAVQTERFSHVNLQLQSENQKFLSGAREVESLQKAISERNKQIEETKTAIIEAKQRLANQEKLIAEKRPAYDVGQEKLSKLAAVYNDLLQKFVERQKELHQKVMEKRQQQPAAFQNNKPAQAFYDSPSNATNTASGFGDSFINNSAPFAQCKQLSKVVKLELVLLATTTVQSAQNAFASPTSPTKSVPHADAQNTSAKPPVKYRALYEFVARTDDELHLQPGDIILVFEDHVAEPGWFAGQLKDKVGWFPAAFAEPMAKKATTAPKQSSITTSPSTEPLESIKEEPTEKEAAFTPSASNAVVSHDKQPPVTNSSLPLYDAPPGNIQPSTTTETPAVNDSQGNGSTTVIATGTALFPWKARNDYDLSFGRGDKIEIYEMAEMRYRGAVVGTTKSGFFPKSYVKLEEGGVKKSASNLSNKLANQQSTESQQSAKNGADRRQSAISNTSATLQSPAATTGNGTSNGSAGEWYVAVYEFQAVEATDLSLKVGDRIWVTDTKDEWWTGTVDGRSGIFPANYVQKSSATPLSSTAPTGIGTDLGMNKLAKAIAAYEATGSNQLSLNVGDCVTVHNTNASGWSEAEIDNKRGWVPTNYLRLADAAFDYEAQRDDELSFKAGDVIEITERTDSQWWRGRIHPGKQAPLLFPSNFVQLRANVSSFVSTKSQANKQWATERSPNLKKQIQELIETEERFGEDLLGVRNTFMKALIAVVGSEGIEKIFLNWDRLIKISKRIHTDLLKHPPGQVIIHRIDMLEAFVTFCEGQQAAIAYLNQLEKSNAKFRKVYQQCVKEPQAKGNHLHDSYQLLKTLCARVNQAITELENKNILCWSQQNIRCESLNRALEFTSDTRELGPREYLHSGILYKAKSNKMLVAILYNDFLLLASPNNPIEDPDSFKVTKDLSLHLTLYKTPLMVETLEVESQSGSTTPNPDNTGFVLKNKSMELQVRALSSNAKSYWISQIQKAIDGYDVKTQLKKAEEDQRKNSITPEAPEVGRLLVEVLNLTNLNSGINNLLLKLYLDESDEPEHSSSVEVRDGQSLYTTQFPLHSTKQKFHLSFFIPMQFRPNVKLGDVTEDIQNIVKIKGNHTGPIIRSLPLKNTEIISGSNCECNVKFAIQIFSNF
ncbi:BMA-ITSN-1, isoform a [Aphelenchoides bicaudatus]|nr:BMA-ITSN-1, isoform a [Aphelenchoides bicaudatus]